MKRRAFLAGFGAAAAAARASAQIPLHPIIPGQPIQPARQLTIGVNVPLSGDLGAYGAQVVQGVRAAIDENNLLSANITQIAYGVRQFDDQNSGAISSANADIAAADSTIIGLVGNLTADVTIATLSQYANSGFAVVVPSVTADALTRRGYHNVYRLPTRDDVAGRLFASTIFRKQASHFALAVTLDGAYGPDVASGFAQQAKADRRNVDIVTLPTSAFDAAGAARAIVARAPDYLFLCGKVAALGPLVPALASAGYNGGYGLSDGFYSQASITQYGAQLGNAVVYSSLPPLDRIPSIIQQLTDLRREVDGITALIAYGYAAAQVIIQGASRQNALTRFSLITAMQMAGGFNTLVGPYSFDSNGDPLIPNLYFFKINGTSFTYLEPAVRNGYVV
ncbi:MAG TPA: ABC transporter substrate-binding protein [Candidatus Tyrphobacter sp.]